MALLDLDFRCLFAVVVEAVAVAAAAVEAVDFEFESSTDKENTRN